MTRLLATLLALPLTALADPPAAPPPALSPGDLGVLADTRLALTLPPAWMADSVVEHAVQRTLTAFPATPRSAAQVLQASKSAQFAATFDDARIPGCLREDGLKFQPTHLGPFTVRGMRAAFPFMVVARLRGKCN